MGTAWYLSGQGGARLEQGDVMSEQGDVCSEQGDALPEQGDVILIHRDIFQNRVALVQNAALPGEETLAPWF